MDAQEGRRHPSRRTMLGVIGLGAVATAGGLSWYELASGGPTPITVARWRAERGKRYLIAHRGAGDVRPEHTMLAYRAARSWGAQAMEISASSTSDGVLICMHDLTYDRTTNFKGVIHDQPSSVLSQVRVVEPQLGPAWTTEPLPEVPLLDEALAELGGHAVLCVEPKRDEDYDAVIAMIHKHKLVDSVMIKLYFQSKKLDVARQAGFPVFAYLGQSDVSVQAIQALAARLDPATDCLVIPSASNDTEEYLPENLVTAAVATGIPVWVYPVHRRSEADRYFGQGVEGVITASMGYSDGKVPRASATDWASQAIAVGEVTREPATTAFAPAWTADGTFTLAARGVQHFVTLGQLSPLKDAATKGGQRYQIDFEARWDALPSDLGSCLSIAFGHSDDRYYEHQLGHSDGYHAMLRATGSLELYRHSAGNRVGAQLGSPLSTTTPVAGQWMRFRVEVSANGISWSRADLSAPAIISTADATYRGGYLHIGRSANNGSLSFRNLAVS
jgi:glycerophosphoryl diester phosphodiesterase